MTSTTLGHKKCLDKWGAVHDKSVNLLSPWQGSLVILRFNLDNFQKNILNYGFELVKAMLLAEEGGVDIF